MASANPTPSYAISNRYGPHSSPSKQPVNSSSEKEATEDDKLLCTTLKRNPKLDLSKTDLLKIQAVLEAELQAKDIVIATLKAERVKKVLVQARYGRVTLGDPYTALQRDIKLATTASSSISGASVLDENQAQVLSEGFRAARDALLAEYRKSNQRLMQVLEESEARHAMVVGELDEERLMHEHDTALGDDVTYGLERERIRLIQELDFERQAKKKLEKDLKKLQETTEEERDKQKQIVLLLLAERKKIIMKYVEERRRSEDLAHILSEEKGRVDSMAEGLEEESKKALQMEAELEKQLADFDGERAQLKGQLMKEEKRCRELEVLMDKLQQDVDFLRKQHPDSTFFLGTSPPRAAMGRVLASASSSPTIANVCPPQLAAKPTVPPTPPRTLPTGWIRGASPAVEEVGQPVAPSTHVVLTTGKLVQPTATVNSVPVAGPTTGIARAISPGGGIRNVQYSLSGTDVRNLDQRPLPTPGVLAQRLMASEPLTTSSEISTSPLSSSRIGSDHPSHSRSPAPIPSPPQGVQVSPRVTVSASGGSKVYTTSQGGKVTFHVTASTTSQPSTPRKNAPPPLRGIPPPVPPNKPVILPKKETIRPPAPMVINPSASATPQMTAIEHGQPISLEMKGGAGPQNVKFGITISKDKIHISTGGGSPSSATATPSSSALTANGSSSSSTGHSSAASDQVGDLGTEQQSSSLESDLTMPAASDLLSLSGRSEHLHAPCSQSSSSAHSVPPPLVAPSISQHESDPHVKNIQAPASSDIPSYASASDLDALNKELADFQQLLYSMASGSPGLDSRGEEKLHLQV